MAISTSSDTSASDSVNTSVVTIPRSWRMPLVFYGLGLLVLLFAYGSTVVSMVAIWWRSETFAHGFLILPITLYLVWLKRADLALIKPRPSLWGAAVMALAAFGWLVASLVEVLVVQQLALVAMIIALTWGLLGWRVVSTIMFPLGFLFFMVPIGEFLIPPMMEFTASFSVSMIQLTGIPVYSEGFFISLPSGDWSIVEGCSGVRYLIASVAVGALYAYLFYYSWWRRVAFVLLATVTPVIANGLRAFMIIMIGHFSDMKLATGIDHLIYGWVFFGIVIMIMFWIGSFWWDKAPEPEAKPITTGSERDNYQNRYWLALPLVLAVLIVAPMALYNAQQSADGPTPVIPVPEAGGGWTLVDQPLSSWSPQYLGATAQRFASYRRDGQQVDLFLYYYLNQSQGAELVNSQNILIRQKHPVWHLRHTVKQSVSLGDQGISMPESLLRSQPLSLLVWEWYWIDGIVTRNDYLAKLLEAWMRLTKPGQGGYGIVISTPVDDQEGNSRKVLQDFTDSLWPAIETSMRNVR